MYNRYIPQSDGSYSRKSVQNPKPLPSKPPPQKQPPQIATTVPHELPLSAGKQEKQKDTGISGFLRQLLPREFDTEDLLIVLLLLLMAGDCPDEKNNTLLTLALYFFM